MDAHIERTVADIREKMEYHRQCLAAGDELLVMLWKLFELPEGEQGAGSRESVPPEGGVPSVERPSVERGSGGEAAKRGVGDTVAEPPIRRPADTARRTGGKVRDDVMAVLASERFKAMTSFTVALVVTAVRQRTKLEHRRASVSQVLRRAMVEGKLEKAGHGRYRCVGGAAKRGDGDAETTGADTPIHRPADTDRCKLAALAVEKGLLQSQWNCAESHNVRARLLQDIQRVEKQMEGLA